MYAHTKKGSPQKEWHLLEDHLEGVGELASRFAEKFKASSWAREIGEKHDIGKYSEAFQNYIKACNQEEEEEVVRPKKVDHSTAGAQLCIEQNEIIGHFPAMCISGHHVGLEDWDNFNKRRHKKIEEFKENVPQKFLDGSRIKSLTAEDLKFIQDSKNKAFASAFFVRMLFSCLIDADRIDTEKFCNPDTFLSRSIGNTLSNEKCVSLLKNLMKYITLRENTTTASEVLKKARKVVRENCEEAASNEAGIFSLTVPTGGGKTLASLLFSLKHAKIHNKDRIIYVAPFTAIIDQTVQVYQNSLEESILEHHSNIDSNSYRSQGIKLASENWDYPIIATTAVQFLESLFASNPSKCRKLHNITNSVIILDEAQTLPKELISPTLRVFEELVLHYNCSIVLCTATQPAVEKTDKFKMGLTVPISEIIKKPENLFTSLKRVQILDRGKMKDSKILEEIKNKEQVLVIVNTRKHAQTLYNSLDFKNKKHLSSTMCSAHRRETLKDVKTDLEKGKPVILVATSVVEAGVDIDFPCVYRSFIGVDSINQSAGRCNREGKIKNLGELHLFESENIENERHVKGSINATKEILRRIKNKKGNTDEILLPDRVKEYFIHYWVQQQNTKKGVGKPLEDLFRWSEEGKPIFDFKTAAESYTVIEKEQKPVCIPWGIKGEKLIKELLAYEEKANPDIQKGRKLLRNLQSYIVNVSKEHFSALVAQGFPLTADDSVCILSDIDGIYNADLGLILGGV